MKRLRALLFSIAALALLQPVAKCEVTSPTGTAGAGGQSGANGEYVVHGCVGAALGGTAGGQSHNCMVGFRGQQGLLQFRDWGDQDLGNILLTITDMGTLGYMDDSGRQGSGLIYPANGSDQIYIGCLWAGLSESYVANRDYGDDPNQEWVVTTEPPGCVWTETSSEDSDQDLHTAYSDDGAVQPSGLLVELESWAFARPANATDIIILRYCITNRGPNALEDLYIGCFLDVDIGIEFTDDEGGSMSDLGLIYLTDASGPYVGACLLQDESGQDPPLANLTFVDNDMFAPYSYIPDENKYRLLSAASPEYVVPETPEPADYRILPSAGPINLDPDAETTVAFAVLGAESLEDLVEHAKVAQLIHRSGITSAPDGRTRPLSTRLLPCRPNPFREDVLIRFDLDHRGRARVDIYDVGGRHVCSLLDAVCEARRYALSWDGTDDAGRAAPAGVYFLRLAADGQSQGLRLVHLR